ncbi:hypothetical protein ABD91_21435 [Lysinibacillus sphaericus]|uniref:hypothetical protein n=1 Tax=Lysinibacillus sphaericus TaxID=1421 RepID=UPI0018CCDACD|nr:hypothetical protein [Lysinibacillus sphaericus]MBG9693301.1 hypothetical protein [Lysinibacillus sphaericus]
MSPLNKMIGIAVFSLLLVGCSEGNYKSENPKPVEEEPKNYEVSEYVDSDGCEYLIVYTEKIGPTTQGIGVGAGITAKPNQPAACMENAPL